MTACASAAAPRWVSQWSVSEHTNIRLPLSSVMISSRKLSVAPHSAQVPGAQRGSNG